MRRFRSFVRRQISYYFPNRQSGLKAEIDFWKYWMESKALGDVQNYEYRLQPDAPIRGFYAELIDKIDREVIDILDVGSGPLTTIGKKYPGKQIHLTAVDPLADAYNQMLAEMSIAPPVKPLPIIGEELSSSYPSPSFDLVMAVNSLDHTEDPIQVIREMIAVCRTGGIVGLVHHEKEGISQNYRDLHQWNFYLSVEDLMVSGRHYRRNINEVVQPFKFVSDINNGFIYSWGMK